MAREFAEGHLGLAAFDFERNGYTADWSPEKARVLHTSRELATAWDQSVADADLAARWAALEGLPAGTLGRRLWEFYRARGFVAPGNPGSAPPLLAQHDWVHVLADYGTRVESELEVFALIARANDDPHGFSLLAMVVSLFETGYLATGAGLFESFPGQLSRHGMALRVADAMRRGALSHGLDGRPDVDLMAVDWFTLADRPVDELRDALAISPKDPRAVAAGSVGPWEAGGISEYQDRSGRAAGRSRLRAGATYEARTAASALAVSCGRPGVGERRTRAEQRGSRTDGGRVTHDGDGPTDPTTSRVTLEVNGIERDLEVDPRTTLLDLLREHLDLTGAKKGCDHGQCGACTVLLDSRRTNSCLVLAVAAGGATVTTVEGLAPHAPELHPLQQAFVDRDALQCGYCTPGQICSAVGMLREAAAGWPSAVTADLTAGLEEVVVLDAAEVRERMSGNLCRCGAYVHIVPAILDVAR